MVTNMLPNAILEVTEENIKHFKCVSITMFMQIMQMSLRVSHSLHLPYSIVQYYYKIEKVIDIIIYIYSIILYNYG